MFRHAGHTTGFLAAVLYMAGSLSFSANAQVTPPNFAPDASVGWYAYNRQFIATRAVRVRCGRIGRAHMFQTTSFG